MSKLDLLTNTFICVAISGIILGGIIVIFQALKNKSFQQLLDEIIHVKEYLNKASSEDDEK